MKFVMNGFPESQIFSVVAVKLRKNALMWAITGVLLRAVMPPSHYISAIPNIRELHTIFLIHSWYYIPSASYYS